MLCKPLSWQLGSFAIYGACKETAPLVGASRARIGAALALGLGIRALSYTRYGFRRCPNHAAAFSAFVEQDLHMLDGGSGVDLNAMADELIASVP